MNRVARNIIKLGAVLMLVGASSLYGAETNCGRPAAPPPAIPQAVVPELSYKFAPVAEGEFILHDFVIQNRGKAPLNILDVKTSCGCTTASPPGPIAPGQEGVVSIKFDSEGWLGAVHKAITVKTDDPEAGTITLVLKGDVYRMYTMAPAAVKLSGPVGTLIREVVIIEPEKDYPFSITKVTAKRGENIRYRYQEVKDKYGTRIEVIVENTRKETGPYFDILTLATDSGRKPEIRIPVFGNIKAAE